MAGGTEVPELTADILSEIENGLKLRINMLNIHEYFFLHKGMEAEML